MSYQLLCGEPALDDLHVPLNRDAVRAEEHFNLMRNGIVNSAMLVLGNRCF